jgi:hypothetical protein
VLLGKTSINGKGSIDVRVKRSVADQILIVDVSGAWTLTDHAVRSGRLMVSAARVAYNTQTRGQKMTAGSTITLSKAQLGVPSSATGVSGIVTMTATGGRGFVSLFPANHSRPVASNVNADAAGQTRTGAAMIALGPTGLRLYLGRANAHISFAVTGYVTGATAAVSTEGLLQFFRVSDPWTGPCRSPSPTVGLCYTGMQTVPSAGLVGTVTVSGQSSGTLRLWSSSTVGNRVAVSSWPANRVPVTTMFVQTDRTSELVSFAPSSTVTLTTWGIGYLLPAHA